MNLTEKHAILEALKTGTPVKSVSIAARAAGDPRIEEIARLARDRGIPVSQAAPAKNLNRGEQPPAVTAVCADFQYADLHDMIAGAGGKPLFLALDHVQDTRNLGAILRSAAAAGVSGVVLQNRRCCDVTGVVCDVSCGGALRVPVARVANLTSTIEVFKKANIWVVGADERAETPCHAYDFTPPTCLVLGSEGEGLARLVREHCDDLIRIPTDPEFPSLNVSVAAAVLLFEARRQRLVARPGGKS